MAIVETLAEVPTITQLEMARVQLADLWFNPSANDEVVSAPLVAYLNAVQADPTFYDRPPYTHVVDRIQRECEAFAALSKRGCTAPNEDQVAATFHANLVDSHRVIDTDVYSWPALLPRTVTLTILDHIEKMIGVR